MALAGALTQGIAPAEGIPDMGFRSAPNAPAVQASMELTKEDENAPRWKLDLMMEKLRQKASLAKPLTETAKNIRAALMDRRCIMDQGDKLFLQKGLDSLQQSITVNSLQSMVERLEMVSRQLSLKFTPGATGSEWFISSDMFYLEILIDTNGVVQEVKIQHEGKTEQQPCPEMVECLRKTDFEDFTEHLEGLVSIYQLNADKKIKSKAFIALQALEADLSAIYGTYSQNNDTEIVIMKSLLGLVQPRKGGHPVKLVYYISPYEFLDAGTKTTLPTDKKTILSRKLGTAATISIQSSSSHKLQMSTTVNIVRNQDGKNLPRYGTLNTTNSTVLPACFMLNLGKPVPISLELVQAIQKATSIDCFDRTNPETILNLIVNNASNGSLECSSDQGLFVALPDQNHCYFMTETPHLQGILVSSISFTLASQLPVVIATLRQQMAFNTLISSCVRVGNKVENDPLVFEVNALSAKNITVSFQHPLDDSLVTLEFNLKDVSHPHCRLHAVANAADIIPTLEELACRVVQRSMSIPITIRTLIRRWQTMKSKYRPPNPDYSVSVGGSNPETFSQLQSNEVSCGTESQQSQQSNMLGNPQIPGIVNASALNINNRTSSKSSTNFPAPSQNPMDILNYMNPLLSQLGMSGNFPMAALPNMAMQMNMSMLAAQMQQQSQNQKGAPMLMNLLDQVGQRGRRRKRKGTSSDSPTNNGNPSNNTNSGNNSNIPRPSPSPSPKSPRGNLMQQPGKSPKRRLSDGSDMSGDSQGDSRAGTPQTPTNSYPGMFGSDQFQQQSTNPGGEMKWNVDITPVSEGIDALIANKLMQGSGGTKDSADVILSSEYDMELDPDLKSSTVKRGPSGSKKSRDFLKRSMSLDSHSTSEDHSSNIQSLMHEGSGSSGGADNLRSLMPPSLSITPVSGSSHGGGSSNVNSLLASIRPGIEIIPIPTQVSIPSSVTVTPIMSSKGGLLDKKSNLGKEKKDEFDKKKFDKKERKRKGDEDGYGDLKHQKLSSSSNSNVFMTIEKSKTLGMTKSLGMSGMNVTQVKKSSSPTVSRSSGATITKSASPTPKVSSGKPSVSTLKSVSSSPKYQSESGISSTTGGTSITKVKSNKERKPGQGNNSSSSNKAVKNLLGMSGSGSGMPPAIPALKPMSSVDNNQLSSALANLSQSLFKSNSESTKGDGSTTVSSSKNDGDKSTSSGSNSNNKEPAKPSIYQAQSQAAAVAAAAIAAQKSAKKGGLLAVIDKLKSQHSVESDNGSSGNANSGNGAKKDSLSKTEGLPNKGNNGNEKKSSGSSTPTSSASTTAPGGSNTSGGGGTGSEYMVKPGGQGLKLTINKTMRPKDLSGLKEKSKTLSSSKPSPTSGGLTTKKPGTPPLIKPIPGFSLAKSPVSSNNGSNNNSSSSGSGPNASKKPSSSSGSKDSSPKNLSKTSKDSSAAGKAQVEMDLTKTLFMPGSVRCLDSTGAVEAPKFDSKFQIPKKSRSTTPLSVPSGSSSDPSKSDKSDVNNTSKDTKNEIISKPKDSTNVSSHSGSNNERPTTESSSQQLEPENLHKSSSSSSKVEPTFVVNDSKSEPPTLIPITTSSSSYPSDSCVKANSALEPDSTTVVPPMSCIEEPSSSSEANFDVPLNLEKVSSSQPPPPAATGELDLSSVTKEAAPPASPDPLTSTTEEVNKLPANIPTTPVNLTPLVEPSPPVVVSSSPVPSPDEDQLIMDIPMEGDNNKSVVVGTTTKEDGKRTPSSSDVGKSPSQVFLETMPPPAPPVSESVVATTVQPSSSSVKSSPVNSPSHNASGSTNVSSSSIPASPGNVPKSDTVKSLMEDTIVSVQFNVIHSPQPNSPALLKSPLALVVPSPHSSHASPYAIDDDLMDEALIGAGK